MSDPVDHADELLERAVDLIHQAGHALGEHDPSISAHATHNALRALFPSTRQRIDTTLAHAGVSPDARLTVLGRGPKRCSLVEGVYTVGQLPRPEGRSLRETES